MKWLRFRVRQTSKENIWADKTICILFVREFKPEVGGGLGGVEEGGGGQLGS